jgi:hypothetical protein
MAVDGEEGDGEMSTWTKLELGEARLEDYPGLTFCGYTLREQVELDVVLEIHAVGQRNGDSDEAIALAVALYIDERKAQSERTLH